MIFRSKRVKPSSRLPYLRFDGTSHLIDIGVEPYLVASSVEAFIAQRLIRKVCPNCKAPAQIAPFEVVVVPINVADEKLRSVAEEIASKLEQAGHDVLLDDRDERPGVKFKDADLVGIPFRVNVGSKKVAEGKVEVFHRSARKSQDVGIPEIIDILAKLLRNEQ